MPATHEFGFPFACGFPAVDAPDMTGADLLMAKFPEISPPQMRENAGQALVVLARRRCLTGDHADATLTLALPKRGLSDPVVRAIDQADISVPPVLYRRLSPSHDAPVFADGDILRLAGASCQDGR